MDEQQEQPVIRRLQDLGELQALLLRACPLPPDNVKSIKKMAKLMGMSVPNIYAIIDKGIMKPDRALDLHRIGEGRVKFNELHPYVYGPGMPKEDETAA